MVRGGLLVLACAVFAQAGDLLPTASLGAAETALTRMFTPRAVPPGTYVVYRSGQTIQDVAAVLASTDRAPTPGAWKPERQDVLDAFDGAKQADRFRLAELYVGVHPFVARGLLARDGRREAYTLISPYPDATLTRLEPGTMIIVFQIPF
jgi:hypothetical protein